MEGQKLGPECPSSGGHFLKILNDTWKSSKFSVHTHDVASEKQDKWASPIKRQMFHVNTMIYNSEKMNVFV